MATESANNMLSGENTDNKPKVNRVFGLSGEMALKGDLSKKAKDRLKKKLKKEQEEEEAQKQMMEKIAKEKEEAAKLKEEQERLKAEEERKKAKLEKKKEKLAIKKAKKKLEAEQQAQEELASQEVAKVGGSTPGKEDQKRETSKTATKVWQQKKDKENQPAAAASKEQASDQ